MKEWVKPEIIISKCIEFDHCRYDGSMIASSFVKKIKPFVHCIPICPEVEVGLGIPRKSLRLVKGENGKQLVQPATKKDVTEEMIGVANAFLAMQSIVHGFILKSRSPSCGIKDVKLYAAAKNAAPIERTSGLFASQVQKQMICPIESEGRLRNPFIQEHFLVSIFTLADFEQVKQSKFMKDLVAFQAKNKFLFMAYHQKLSQQLGRTVANHEKKPIDDVLNIYEHQLLSLLSIPPSHKTTVNVLFHLFGFVSDEISKKEKDFFLDLIEQYKNKKISLNAMTMVLKSWAIRFAEPYLLKQTIFSPFPDALLDEEVSMIADRQEYWK